MVERLVGSIGTGIETKCDRSWERAVRTRRGRVGTRREGRNKRRRRTRQTQPKSTQRQKVRKAEVRNATRRTKFQSINYQLNYSTSQQAQPLLAVLLHSPPLNWPQSSEV